MDYKNLAIDLIRQQGSVNANFRSGLGSEETLSEEEITAAQHAWEQSATRESWTTFLKLWPSRKNRDEYRPKSNVYSVEHADIIEDVLPKIKMSKVPDSNDNMGWGIEEQEIEIDADNYDAIPCRFKGIYPDGNGLRFTAKLIGVKVREIRYVSCTMATYKVEPS